MAKFMRLEVIQTILKTGLLPLFYNEDSHLAIELVEAIASGGADCIEFTNRGENAYPVFVTLVSHFVKANQAVILGVGSIIDAPTAAIFINAGANFIVGPSFNPEIARLCNRRKILYIPGCATETEISTAEEFGTEICKIFPGEAVGGPAYIKAVMAPCPWHRLMPTGGVDATQESIQSWIKAGAAAVGMGSKLISKDIIQNKDFAALSLLTTTCLGWIKNAREKYT
ncbi:MAG: bifunctional 4-hydroxy-2-oxoglutarate aldolase/2-dehydro-3-deoxy-phosphogluconate aldolase [Chloroflexi bacterium HGW-Chloroflexi-10]|nr:MAG: bifunctional 4-hydroxy-2-oxoglutarate aldolase/2-dehydro-3-deoxy-phosphogluconate aldolase [Chloroflexi bacterium HGW-Chloroflexi-10]